MDREVKQPRKWVEVYRETGDAGLTANGVGSRGQHFVNGLVGYR
jgi:hypothetical protein